MKWMFFLILIVGFSACKKDELLNVENHLKKEKYPKDGFMYNRIERMPVLKECYNENLSWSKIKKCSDEKLLETIYSNIKYPSIQRCNFSKRVIVQFTIEVDGSISNIRFPRTVESFFENETRRLINLLPEWKPGNFYGKDVPVQYTLPIKFCTN